MRYRTARLIYDNNVEGTGSLAVTDCALAPSTRALLLGDSYAYPFAKFLAESFRRLVFAHAPTLDARVVDAVRPQIAVTEIAERFLVVVQDDASGRSMAMREQRKRDNGRIRPPLQYWTWPMLVSPGPVEVMRERLLAEGRIMETALVSVMAYAGLRPSEAMALRWSAIEQDAIAIVAGPGNAKGRTRRVPLWRPLAQDLEAWRRRSGRGGDQLVFVEDGRPMDLREWREHTYQGLALSVGLQNRRPAFLREVFCVLMINAGVSIGELAELVDMERERLEYNFAGLWNEMEKGRARAIDPQEAIARARSEFLR
jgi:integrase